MMNARTMIQREKAYESERQARKEIHDLLVGRTISDADLNLTTQGDLQKFTLTFDDGDKISLYEDVIDVSKCKPFRQERIKKRVCVDPPCEVIHSLEVMINKKVATVQKRKPMGKIQEATQTCALETYTAVMLLIKNLKNPKGVVEPNDE